MPHFAVFALCALVLAAAFAFAHVAARAGFPPAVAIVLVGIAVGGMLPPGTRIELEPATLAFFLPALIFEGAWNLGGADLGRTGAAIAVLATLGTLVTAAAIACAGIAGGGMSLVAACALGAILSATDPVAVLALFRRLDVPARLATIVEGESIANDGVAAALLAAAVLSAAGAANAAGLARVLLLASVGGALLGAACAFAGAPLVRRFEHAGVRIVVTLAVAYASFAVATKLGWSGIFASAAAGATLHVRALRRTEDPAIERFWDALAYLANGIVFLLVGLSLQVGRMLAEPALIAAVLLAVAAARAALAYVIVPLPRDSLALRHGIALAGVRGGLSLALALGLAADFPDRPRIVDATFAVVFLTLVVQGYALTPLIRGLKFETPVGPRIRSDHPFGG